MRRPSPAMLVALVALFVALGGPAQARRMIEGSDIRKGTVRSTQIKDGTITTRDLSSAAKRSLQTTPDGSVTAAQLAGGAVTAGKLGTGSVGGGAIADGAVTAVDLAEGAVASGKLAGSAVTGANVADGTLSAADIARFSGSFRITAESFGIIDPHQCWNRAVLGLAPEQAGADISQDAVLVVPRTPFSERALSFSYRLAAPSPTEPASQSRFVLAFCNVTDAPVTPPDVSFSYIVFDVP